MELGTHLDIIDSREITERIEELELSEELSDGELHELASLRDLARQGELASDDWAYGVTLVRESYFEDYARDYAEDIGAVRDTDGMEWPRNHIDWPAAAAELACDYTELDFDGVAYLVR